MLVLVIAGPEWKVDTSYISQQLNTEVTLNSVARDGVSIYECGTPIPQENWDWVATVGKCMIPMLEENTVAADVDIPLDEDPTATLIAAVASVMDGMAIDQDTEGE